MVNLLPFLLEIIDRRIFCLQSVVEIGMLHATITKLYYLIMCFSLKERSSFPDLTSIIQKRAAFI